MLKRYQFTIGQRVVLRAEFNIDMNFSVPEGTECVICGFICNGHFVAEDVDLNGLKLDLVLEEGCGNEVDPYNGITVKPLKHFDELNEWNNELYIWTSFVDVLEIWHATRPLKPESAVKVLYL